MVERNIPVMDHQSIEGHCELVFRNVRVPSSALLGNEGAGFAMAQARQGPGRVHPCMRSIGQCDLALELMCERALERRAFGSRVADFANVQAWIARSRVEIDQARLLVLHAAWRMDRDGNAAARVDVAAISLSTQHPWPRVSSRRTIRFDVVVTQPGVSMRIRVGFEIEYRCPQPTPMILALSIHYSRASDLVRPDHLLTNPSVPITAYRDLFGNWCSRLVASEGRFVIGVDTTIYDTGAVDVVAPWVQRFQSRACRNRSWCICWAAAIARPTCSPASRGSSSGRGRPGGSGCRRSAISCTSASSSATSMRAGPVPRVMPIPKAAGSAVTMRISRSRSAAA